MAPEEYKMLKELFEEKLERIHDSVTALADRSTQSDNEIIRLQKITNGRVNKLEERMEKVEGDTALISSLAKNKTFILILIAVLSGTSLSQVIPLIAGLN